jgi:hypothetical protein
MSTIEDLVTRHKASTSERERAEIERDLWDNHSTAGDRAEFVREKWLAELTGAVGNKIGIRQTLLNAGPDIDAIWARIDRDKMPLRTAWGQLKNAEEYAAEAKTGLAKGVEIALAEYDSWPMARTKDGQLYRRRPPYSLRRPRKRRAVATPDGDKKFWTEIKRQVSTFMGERLGNVDHLTASQIQGDFAIRLQTLCDEFGSKINLARRRAQNAADTDAAVIKFAAVRQACGVLAIDPPGRNGERVDLDRANRNKKKLAVQYHPDRNPNGQDRYNEVIEAFTTIEAYNDQLKEVTANG